MTIHPRYIMPWYAIPHAIVNVLGAMVCIILTLLGEDLLYLYCICGVFLSIGLQGYLLWKYTRPGRNNR